MSMLKGRRFRFGIMWKMVLAAMLVIAVLIVYISVYALPEMRRDLFEEKKSRAKKVSLSEVRSSSTAIRLRNNLVRLFSPYL